MLKLHHLRYCLQRSLLLMLLTGMGMRRKSPRPRRWLHQPIDVTLKFRDETFVAYEPTRRDQNVKVGAYKFY